MGAALLVLTLVSEDCNKTPTAASPAPEPGPAPTITCGTDVAVTADASDGALVTFPLPENHGGEGDVKVTCTPASGERFPVGATDVTCSITDVLNRTASCGFAVIVAAPPPVLRLRLTRFMAFGDSLTLGQMVVPGTDDLELQSDPQKAYPAVLSRLLTARYNTQNVLVTNQGRPGELAESALGRLVAAFNADLPEAVLLFEGMNDLYRAKTGELGIAAAEASVSELAAYLRSRHARVFIINLPPSRPGRRQVAMSTIQFANQRLSVVARGEGAYLIDIFSALLPDVNAMVGSDGLHLTEAGYARVAETVFTAIRDDLEIK